MRDLDEILSQVGGSTILSKLDLKSRFHQIPVGKYSRDYTTFISPWGKYRFTVMPFGLKNAPAIFQTIMDNTLRPCNQFTIMYIDDVLIFSSTVEDHLDHIQKTLTSKKAGFKVKLQKCQWGKKMLLYIRHYIQCLGTHCLVVHWNPLSSTLKFIVQWYHSVSMSLYKVNELLLFL